MHGAAAAPRQRLASALTSPILYRRDGFAVWICGRDLWTAYDVRPARNKGHPLVDRPGLSLFERHEFLIRRLHSLSGLIPVGAFMVVHLSVNASVLESPGAFQRNVYSIHGLGSLLPLVEWVFIFLPILFHAIIGLVIIQGGLPNQSSYPLAKNYRYTLQRGTGIIAFFFIMWHVFHMHGWFHSPWWVENVAEPFDGHQFRAYSAASTAGIALQGIVVPVLYAIGILACVYHLANGIWTMGITWGVWTSARAQDRASVACTVFGVALTVVGLSALWGIRATGHGDALQRAQDVETRMYQHRVATGELPPTPAKRAAAEGEELSRSATATANR